MQLLDFQDIYLAAGLLILGMMSILWIISVIVKNASIVDPFWGFGFVVTAAFYFTVLHIQSDRSILIMVLAAIWGLRLSGFLFWRNMGKGEDFRYQNFRKNFGEKRYWWVSYFQTFLLQGILMWLISAPLLAAMYYGQERGLYWLDYAGILVWFIGFYFESVGDIQLTLFKANPDNKGKVMDRGLWKYTRHPNYFGDATVWWGFALISLAAGGYIQMLGAALMTFLLVRVSGVAMLEKTLKKKGPAFAEYQRKTSAFFPWFPKT